MSTLVSFDAVQSRLHDFYESPLGERCDDNPIINGIIQSVVYLEWEGTPSVLSDALMINSKDDFESFRQTMDRLGYQCETKKISKGKFPELKDNEFPCLISYKNKYAIVMSVDDTHAQIYDYHHDVMQALSLENLNGKICHVTSFSRLFREAPPQSQDRQNWVKYCFYKYGRELKTLIGLSFVINLLGAIPPFFIMAVYNFALSSQSSSTLLWLASGGIIVATLELFYKKMRLDILTTSGKELSVYVSYHVLSKLLWLPYAMTSGAGVSSQLARLRDIDQIRTLATNSSTISYFDLPFVVIFLVAILAIAGTVALTVLAGIIAMFGFCLYARFIYQKATKQSSRANALVSYQWNDLLTNLPSIQGLPILKIIQSRFQSAHHQSMNDAQNVQITNAHIQRMGQAFIQIIGATSIVVAVYATMQGASDAGAMIAIIILVWKILTPIMGVYNAIIRFQTFQNSSDQINKLMSINDNRQNIEKSAPINHIKGDLLLKDVTQRYPGALSGLTQLNIDIKAGEKVAVCGPAGCGKTTLLNMIGGIWENYQGGIFCDGYNIRQFNNFTYRNSIRYVPIHLHFFEGSLRENFIFYNGILSDEKMNERLQFFDLHDWFGEQGLDRLMTHDFLINLPNGIREMLRLCIGLGNVREDLVLIDEPMLGCARDFHQKLNALFSDHLRDKTVIYTTQEKSLVTLCDQSLLLDENGAQKYFGFPDKILQIMP